MDLITPKQLKSKIGIDDRMHKEKTLKILIAYNKAKQAFGELRIKIKEEKDKIINDYSNFIERKNKEKQILLTEIKGFNNKKDELFKPLLLKEEGINLKIVEKREMFNAYEKLKRAVDDKIERNQILLDNAEKAKSYCQMREKNVGIKEKELDDLDNKLNDKENNINSLEKQSLALIETKNEELDKRIKDVEKNEIIVKADIEVIETERIELRHIRLKLQDEREALNRAKQEIYGRS